MGKTGVKAVVWSPESRGIVLSRQIEKACPAHRPVLQAFADWLMGTRGMGAETTTQRVSCADVFLAAVRARAALPWEQALAVLTVDEVENFFVEYGKDRGLPTRRIMQTAMRLFLRFAAVRGWVDAKLAETVPKLQTYRLSGLPRGLSEEQLTKLLEAPWKAGECPRRDRAIVQLLATYGARREQVSALRLSDIDWREQTLVFAAHKRGKAIHHALTPAVAQALVEYLREERPSSDCAHVFLRHRPPHVRLSPMAISDVVEARMVRCGLPPRGSHTLRHTFATRLLQAGQPIKAIADLLGHRSLDAVAIYAKVDVGRLLEVAVDWPEVVP
ncbi:MAG: tyrosine-type recombinase/integrase [Thermoanaerobaculia bacterium]|nr:tyrosine-type recombinase/integrase [Thermoanaerobaculia bacterium]